MKSNLLSPFLVVFLVISVLAVLPPGPGPLAGGTIYVDDDNTSGIEDGTLANPYNTIQEGVDAAASGDTVFVFGGTYRENVWVDNTLNLEGEDMNSTIIDTGTVPPLSDYPCIVVVADDVSVSGFSNVNGAVGIAVGFCSGASIFGNMMSTVKCMEVVNTTGNNIFGNRLLNTSFGIYLSNAHSNTISGNTIIDVGFAVSLSFSLNNVITGNNITKSGFCIDLKYSNETIVTDNIIMDGQFPIETYQCQDNFISGNTIVNNTAGMQLRNEKQSEISDNFVSRNNNGIKLSDSEYCVVTGNTVVANMRRGIDLSSSSNNTIANNNASGNEYGVALDFDSNTNYIFNNTVHDNWQSGMYLASSSLNTIANNSAEANLYYGLFFRSHFTHNLVTGNYIHSNANYGLYADYGTEGNLIHHNHFEANNGATDVFNSSHKQAYAGGTNTWNDVYPSGGNYWSDWLSPDAMSGPLQDVTGADGFVDLPYYLTNLGQDNYPLTRSPLGPTGPPEATIDLDPDTLNLKSKGKWITCYIELPCGYDPRDINASTILLNDAIPPELNPKYGFVKDESGYIMDHDNDTIEERMVKFDRSAVQEMLGQPYDSIALNVTGELYDGTPFSGYDTIRVIDPPKKKP